MAQTKTTKILSNHWAAVNNSQDKKIFLSIIDELPTIEIAEWITTLDISSITQLFINIDFDKWGVIFAELEDDLAIKIFHSMDIKQFISTIFNRIPSDQRADFYQLLEEEDQMQLLPFLTKSIRENVIALSAYPTETAGGIMSTDFATIHCNMTVQEALVKLREDSPSKKMIYYLYVVNDYMELIGFATLKDLIMASPSQKIATILHDKFIYALVNEDRESVAQKIAKYDLVAIPVLNISRQLVGIVLHDDAIDVIRAEETEDMEKFMGIVPDDEEQHYLRTSSLQHFKKRIVWIIGLFIASFFSTIVIHQYELILKKFTILALYIPMIANAGGNSGSQSASVVIRALAVGQISLNNWLSILFKEARIAFLVAGCLFFLAFGKIFLLSGYTNEMENLQLYHIAFTISLALSLQIITATLIGTTLPLLVKSFKGDPSIVASPAITTLVDITGIFLYFAIVTSIL